MLAYRRTADRLSSGAATPCAAASNLVRVTPSRARSFSSACININSSGEPRLLMCPPCSPVDELSVCDLSPGLKRDVTRTVVNVRDQHCVADVSLEVLWLLCGACDLLERNDKCPTMISSHGPFYLSTATCTCTDVPCQSRTKWQARPVIWRTAQRLRRQDYALLARQHARRMRSPLPNITH